MQIAVWYDIVQNPQSIPEDAIPMEKKKLYVPENTINIGRFDVLFPSLSPEDYVAYLQRSPVKQLALNTEDEGLQKHEYSPHTSFVFKKETGQIRVWVSGTIYTTNNSGILVTGKTSVERSDVMLILLVSFIAFLTNPTDVENLVISGGAFLMLAILTFLLVWIVKRKTIQLLQNVKAPV